MIGDEQAKSVKIGVFDARLTLGSHRDRRPGHSSDALYVELTDRIIPSRGLARSGPGKPPEVTDAELVCLAVAQVLLRYDDERHWLRAAPPASGTCSRGCCGQSEYNERLKSAAPLMEAALRWLADADAGHRGDAAADGRHPVPCGHSVITPAARMYGWAGYGYCPSHSRWYWGVKLCSSCTCDGTVTGSAWPTEAAGECEQAGSMLERQPATARTGTAIVTDKGVVRTWRRSSPARLGLT